MSDKLCKELKETGRRSQGWDWAGSGTFGNSILTLWAVVGGADYQWRWYLWVLEVCLLQFRLFHIAVVHKAYVAVEIGCLTWEWKTSTLPTPAIRADSLLFHLLHPTQNMEFASTMVGWVFFVVVWLGFFLNLIYIVQFKVENRISLHAGNYSRPQLIFIEITNP